MNRRLTFAAALVALVAIVASAGCGAKKDAEPFGQPPKPDSQGRTAVSSQGGVSAPGGAGAPVQPSTTPGGASGTTQAPTTE